MPSFRRTRRSTISPYDVPDGVLTEVTGLDPALSPNVRAGYLVEGEGVVDPGRFVNGLADAVIRLGGRITEKVEVNGFRRTSDGAVDAALTSYGEIRCSGVVVAAGIWSRELAWMLGQQLPLQAGKGYSFSVELDPAPRHALYFGDKRIVASPIGGSTRIAGTMELSGNNNDLDWRRIVAIARGSRDYLGPWFHHPDELVGLIRDPWVGGRPFLPDGLPVIDRLPDTTNAFVATGHGMLGVTLGPATGTAVADYLLTGTRPDVLAPFSFGRLR
jgi:D-amino-acid dehydrogenase